MGATPTGFVIAAGLGAGAGQLARVALRAVRGEGDVVAALAAEVPRLVREGVRIGSVLAALLFGYWLFGLAIAIVLLLLLAGLFAGGGLDSGAAPVLIGAAALGAIACFGMALVLGQRALRRIRDVVQADLDLGVPLLGPGRLLVWISSVSVAAGYVALSGGPGRFG